MGRLKNKVAVITGASKGFGAAIARRFASEGASVVVNYAASKDSAERVVADIVATGGKAIAVKANVTDRSQIESLFATTIAAFGKLDILVNNAGTYEFLPIETITEEHFHKLFDLNVLGTMLVTQEGLKHFGPEGGSVINMSSIVSLSPPAVGPVYSATKGAIDAFTKSSAKALASRRIRFNTLNPGLIGTDGVLSTGALGESMLAHTLSHTPLGRAGMVEDVTAAALFLAADESSFITGEGIVISGGLGLR